MKNIINILCLEVYKMLGGSFLVGFLRNSMSAGLIMIVFLLLDHPKFSLRKTIWHYVWFSLFILLGFTFWYEFYMETFIRFAGMITIPVIGIFCVCMSSDPVYLSLYKLTLGFYLLTVSVFLGVDVSRMWFLGNMWVDIIIRFILMVIVITVIAKRFRKRFMREMNFIRSEMDLFSIITVFLSVLIAALMAFWPDGHEFSVWRIVRLSILLFMAGIIQFMVFYLYLHRGREERYEEEKKIHEINEQLLRQHLEAVQKEGEEAARIRHDVRHHCLMIEECIKNEQKDKLLAYVQQYRQDLEEQRSEYICANETINGILSIYARRAREENIQVTMKVKIGDNILVRDIDLVAVLANIFENAIYGCVQSYAAEQKINIDIVQKGKKIVICCKNTCDKNIKFQNGLPKSENREGIGVTSVLKVVSYYHGEADFSIENSMFAVKILLNNIT